MATRWLEGRHHRCSDDADTFSGGVEHDLRVWGFRFKFWGLVFGVWGLGDSGLGFGVWGFGFQVMGLGFGDSGLGSELRV